MRTTVVIDDDVLLATKEIASQSDISLGKVLSNLARQALSDSHEATTRNGLPLFPRRPDGQVVTLELVNQLRDELP